MRAHCVLEKARQTWLPFEFPVFLCGAGNLTCILGALHLQMSSRTCMAKMRSCVVQHSGNHGRRLSSNGLGFSCSCTEILTFLTTNLELPSPLLSDSPFSPPNSFLFFFIFDLFGTQNRDPPFDRTFHRPCDHKISITSIAVIENFIVNIRPKPKSRPP
jgi:hypothetical protein